MAEVGRIIQCGVYQPYTGSPEHTRSPADQDDAHEAEPVDEDDHVWVVPTHWKSLPMPDPPLPKHLDPQDPMATMRAIQKGLWLRIPAAERKLLADDRRKHPSKYCTGCSGTDGIVLWIGEGGRLIGQAPGVGWVHAFSCESDAKKACFIQQQYPDLKKCFSDLSTLAGRRGINSFDSRLRPADVDDVEVIIIGLVCKDISSCNSQMSSHLGGTKARNRNSRAIRGCV